MAMGTMKSKVVEEFRPTRLARPFSQMIMDMRPTAVSNTSRPEHRATPTTMSTAINVAMMKGTAVFTSSSISRLASMATPQSW